MKNIILRFLLILGLVILVLIGNLVIFNIRSKKASQGAIIQNYSNPTSALLIIDVQGGTTGETSATPCYIDQAPLLIENINTIIDSATHNNIPVIYIVNAVKNPLVNVLNNTMAFGTVGSQIDKRLILSSDYVIDKQKNDAFSNPQLDSLLISHQINHLFITGLDACFCVKSTIEGALNRGYKITVVSNGIVASSDSLKTAQLQQFEKMGVIVQ